MLTLDYLLTVVIIEIITLFFTRNTTHKDKELYNTEVTWHEQSKKKQAKAI